MLLLLGNDLNLHCRETFKLNEGKFPKCETHQVLHLFSNFPTLLEAIIRFLAFNFWKNLSKLFISSSRVGKLEKR